MNLHLKNILVCTQSKQVYLKIKKTVPKLLAKVCHAEDVASAQKQASDAVLILVDQSWLELPYAVQALLEFGRYSVLILPEKAARNDVPEVVVQGIVDDLLLFPLRPIELLGKLKHVQYKEQLRDVVSANASLKALIQHLEEDLRTARSIQRAVIPEKFAPVQGVRVNHKYLSGMKSGGDYLDFFEFEDRTNVGVLMSDSTGYGLSSAFMSVIFKLGLKLSRNQIAGPSQLIAQILEELKLTMRPQEELSLAFGIFNRKTFEFQYAGVGNISVFHNEEMLKFSAKPFRRDSAVEELVDQKIWLEPNDRLVLLSDGFTSLFDSMQGVRAEINRTGREDALELINSMCFQVKKALPEPDDFPEQDCSVMVLDIEASALRLAKAR